MAGILRWILAMVIAVTGLNAAARLQVFENASFAVKGLPQSEAFYKGTVSRDLLSGDWIVQQADGRSQVIPDASFGAMAYNGNGITLASKMVAGLAILLVFVCFIGPATIFRAIQLLRKPSP